MKKGLAVLFVVLLFACLTASVFAEEIVINYPTFQIGVNTSAPVVANIVKGFNEKYAGQYKIVVEEVPGDSNYFEKMQVMISSGELPPVVYGAGKNLLDLALAKDLVIDLTDIMGADEEWMAGFSDKAWTANARNGRIYAAPSEGGKVGYFYNKELFAQAGIEKPAETWDEWFEIADKLKAAGITPFAMDTGDGAWCTQLMMGAMIATYSDEGLEFMNTYYPYNYDIDPVIKAAEMIVRMFDEYTTLDAVGGLYENAANNFFNGKVAMIANGPWMIGDFSDTSKAPEGFDQKVGTAIYPGGFVYEYQGEGLFATKQGDPALEEAAIEFIRYFTSPESQLMALETQGLLPASPIVQVSDAAKEKFPILADFLEKAAGATKSSNNFTGNMFSNMEDIVSQQMPLLAPHVITPEEFAHALTEGAELNK